jgi:hypothetical protein
MTQEYEPHFKGKSAYDHLKDARQKGRIASESVHGAEPSGYVIAGIDACKETTLYLFMAFLLLSPFSFDLAQKLILFSCFTLGLILWKTTRSALFGWARMERVHRLIKEEKFEIEHNREQEKEELLELYKAKGFKDKQLEEVVEVLMADDNRLLQIMLEEELGLTMGSFEHPLKQCIGAALGVLVGSFLALVGLYFGGFFGLILCSFFSIFLSSYIAAKHLNNDITKHIIWNLSSAFLSLSCLYFLMQCFINYLPQA